MVAHFSSPELIVILKADRFCSEALRGVTSRVFPAASVVEARSLAEMRQRLQDGRVDLLIAGTMMRDGDTGDLLAQCGPALPGPRRVLIVTDSFQPHVLRQLRALPVTGLFDSANECTSTLPEALQRVAAGESFWSESALECLGSEAASYGQVCKTLTLTEQLVFSAAGEGSDDRVVAGKLGMTPCAVQSVRRNLHRKFGLQQRGELVRLAAQLGYVRFTPEGAVHPGFDQMYGEWRAQRERRMGLAAR